MKRPRKKNIIPPARLGQLRASPVYEIRCKTPDCVCGNPSAGCGRGFFSLFIQAINGIAFAKRFQIPYYVNYTDYAYSQPGHADQNFWNYYFDQPIKVYPDGKTVVVNELIETYPLRIWDRDFARSLARVMSEELIYREEVKKEFDDLKKRFDGKRVLGVHFRGTDHPDEILPIDVVDYFDEIDKRISRFDSLFLATDDHAILDLFSRKYGNKLWTNEVIRSRNGDPLHGDIGIGERYRLGLDALTDCYALSLCQEVILTQSNLSYAALLFNPELKYKLMEKFPTSVKRLTTLGLYYLDKWNIRKW